MSQSGRRVYLLEGSRLRAKVRTPCLERGHENWGERALCRRAVAEGRPLQIPAWPGHGSQPRPQSLSAQDRQGPSWVTGVCPLGPHAVVAWVRAPLLLQRFSLLGAGFLSASFPGASPVPTTVPGTEHAPGPSAKGSEKAGTSSSVTSPEQAPELPRGGPRPLARREAVGLSPPPSLDRPPELGDREIHLSQGPGGHLRPEPWTPAVAVGPSPDPSWPMATKAGRARGFAAQLRPGTEAQRAGAHQPAPAPPLTRPAPLCGECGTLCWWQVRTALLSLLPGGARGDPRQNAPPSARQPPASFRGGPGVRLGPGCPLVNISQR